MAMNARHRVQRSICVVAAGQAGGGVQDAQRLGLRCGEVPSRARSLSQDSRMLPVMAAWARGWRRTVDRAPWAANA
jgi:hypothetical protein